MAKLPGAYETLATVGAPAINFARGLLGYQDPFLTQTMQDRMKEIEGERTRGNVGYEDYGLDSSAGRFTGGLMNLAINNPVDFGLAGSIGKYDFGPEGRKGLTYDFTPDRDTGSTGNVILDFINRGGLKGAFSRMGTAEASDLGAIASNEMLQSILNPKTPKLATTFLESMNRGPIVDDDPYPPEFFPNDQQDSLEVDMGATGTIPTLALDNTGIISAVNNVPFGTSVDNIQGFTDKEDFSTIKPTGIARLFKFLGNIPTPFNLVRRGLESLSGFNQRLRNTDFGQSRTGAEYMMRRRERKQAERAREANRSVYESADRQGFTNDRGGFSTSRADRAGTSLGSGQFSSKRSTGRQGY